MDRFEPFIYNTYNYPTREECWEDLGKYLKELHEKGDIWLREVPEVISETDFDTKEVINQGFVRGVVVPCTKTLNLTTMGYE
jgi:hypothetical protein